MRRKTNLAQRQRDLRRRNDRTARVGRPLKPAREDAGAVLRRRVAAFVMWHGGKDVPTIASHFSWPVSAVALWVATLAGVVQLVRGRAHGAGLSALLAVHWAWSGVVDHARCFSGINPAAWLFVALFEGRPAVSLPS